MSAYTLTQRGVPIAAGRIDSVPTAAVQRVSTGGRCWVFGVRWSLFRAAVVPGTVHAGDCIVPDLVVIVNIVRV